MYVLTCNLFNERVFIKTLDINVVNLFEAAEEFGKCQKAAEMFNLNALLVSIEPAQQ